MELSTGPSRLLCKVEEENIEKKIGGIFIPDSSTGENLKGDMLAIGETAKALLFSSRASSVKPERVVLHFHKSKGFDVIVEGVLLRSIHIEDVLACELIH